MSSSTVKACGLAAAAGGAMWAAKGIAILITGDQPPLLFEVPLALFPIGLLGLHARLRGHDGRLRRAGRAVSLVALVAAAVAAALFGVDPLILLGAVTRRAAVFPARWAWLPWGMGLATPVLMSVVGGILSEINERLLEVPLVLLAAAWIKLGLLIADPGERPVAAPHAAGEGRG